MSIDPQRIYLGDSQAEAVSAAILRAFDNTMLPNATKDPAPMGDTPSRNIRVDDELWKAAQARAAENDETVAQVIRRALREYVKGQS